MKILDASSVICILKEIEEPRIYRICEKLNHELYITKEVHEELQKNELTYKKFQEFGRIRILNSDYPDEIETLKKRYIWMHDGEASIICAAKILIQANIPFHCVIDERARKVAQKMGIPATGTIGLILWEKERGQLVIDYLQEIKTKLSESPFRLSKDLLELLTS